MKRPRRLVLVIALACLGLVGVVAVRSASARSALTGPAAEVVPPHQRASRRPSLEKLAARVTAPAVDLLDRIDIEKDALVEHWGFQDRSLIIPWNRYSRLQIPCRPPEEYDVRVTVTRKNGMGAFFLGFVYRGRQGVVGLDTGGDGSAQLFADSESLPRGTSSASKQMLFRRNAPTAVLLSVRKGGLTISVAGQTTLEWKGEPEDLADSYRFRVPDPRTLFLGSYETVYRIEELVLTPVTGSPEFLR